VSQVVNEPHERHGYRGDNMEAGDKLRLGIRHDPKHALPNPPGRIEGWR